MHNAFTAIVEMMGIGIPALFGNAGANGQCQIVEE